VRLQNYKIDLGEESILILLGSRVVKGRTVIGERRFLETATSIVYRPFSKVVGESSLLENRVARKFTSG